MAAYVVGQLDVKNTNWQQDYGPQARALLEKHGGKVIVGPGGVVERLEGTQKWRVIPDNLCSLLDLLPLASPFLLNSLHLLLHHVLGETLFEPKEAPI